MAGRLAGTRLSWIVAGAIVAWAMPQAGAAGIIVDPPLARPDGGAVTEAAPAGAAAVRGGGADTTSSGRAPVPAPAALGLFALGVLGIVAGRRRRT